MNKKSILKFAVLVTTLLLPNTALAAKDMVVGTWLSPKHPHNAIVMKTWGDWINTATEGRVNLQLKYHQGHPKDIFGGVEDGNYDAGWSFHGYLPGKFKLTVMPELPLLGAEAEAASLAYWRVHQKYLAAANEHQGLTLAGLFLHGPGQIMLRAPVQSLADMKNKKIRVGGGVQGQIAEALGVKAVPAPGSKVYEILSQGVADGVFMPVGEQNTLRLSEVTKFIYESPGGMYLGSFGIFISPDFLRKIGKKDADAIMAVSGESLSLLAGRAWANNDINGYAKAKEANVNIVRWSDADVNRFNGIATDIEKNWLLSVADRKIDAKQALAEFRTIARNYPY
ncbi:MAG: TRAP transporter substrate-binding protein [Proteobacteria bacterium]|nr:TRAP transporter substrate-binding protein [Pseudomonadota bacterium]MCH9757749.1 TRAP transporter substrate-binding protein [Pseudomonadota bacterium]